VNPIDSDTLALYDEQRVLLRGRTNPKRLAEVEAELHRRRQLSLSPEDQAAQAQVDALTEEERQAAYADILNILNETTHQQ